MNESEYFYPSNEFSIEDWQSLQECLNIENLIPDDLLAPIHFADEEVQNEEQIVENNEMNNNQIVDTESSVETNNNQNVDAENSIENNEIKNNQTTDTENSVEPNNNSIQTEDEINQEDEIVEKTQHNTQELDEETIKKEQLLSIVNESIDLSDLIKYFSTIGLTPKKFACSKGFKSYDEMDRQFKTPIVSFISRQDFFDKEAQLYKEIQINNNYTMGAVIFDMDVHYLDFEPKLKELISRSIIPAPSYITIRPENGHFHLVYLLNKRVGTKYHQKRMQYIRQYFTKCLQSDVGYHNTYTHNPFYEYLFDKKQYFRGDKYGYVTLPSPITGPDGNVSRKDKLEFKAYSIYDLSDYSYSVYQNKQQKELAETLENIHNNPFYKKEKFNPLTLDNGLSKNGLIKAKADIDMIGFKTGPTHRNNTLFYNTLAFLNEIRNSNYIKHYNDVEKLFLYIQNAYYDNYEKHYPLLEKMNDSEFYGIARSVYDIHFNKQTNYVFQKRDWHGRDCDANGNFIGNEKYAKIKNDRVFPEVTDEFDNQYNRNPKYKNEDPNEINDFIKKQRENGVKSGIARQKIQHQRQQTMQKFLTSHDFEKLSPNQLKELMAKRFRCSIRTIERDLKTILEFRKETFQPFQFYVNAIKQQTKKFKYIHKQAWHKFILETEFHANSIYDVITAFKNFLDKFYTNKVVWDADKMRLFVEEVVH